MQNYLFSALLFFLYPAAHAIDFKETPASKNYINLTTPVTTYVDCLPGYSILVHNHNVKIINKEMPSLNELVSSIFYERQLKKCGYTKSELIANALAVRDAFAPDFKCPWPISYSLFDPRGSQECLKKYNESCSKTLTNICPDDLKIRRLDRACTISDKHLIRASLYNVQITGELLKINGSYSTWTDQILTSAEKNLKVCIKSAEHQRKPQGPVSYPGTSAK